MVLDRTTQQKIDAERRADSGCKALDVLLTEQTWDIARFPAAIHLRAICVNFEDQTDRHAML